MKILDVSKYQPNIDYAQVAKQVDGVILRCGVTGWGTANQCSTDDCFEKHYAGFKAVGLPVGAYYYSAADTIAKAQEEAEYCKKILAGKRFELPIYYDVECRERMNKLSKEQLTAQVIAWCDKMEQAGYFVGVYSYTSFINEKLDIASLAQRYTIWLADYRQNYDRTIPRDMHQYTSTAQIAGIAGGVDMSNLFRTNLMETIQETGLNGFAKKADEKFIIRDLPVFALVRSDSEIKRDKVHVAVRALGAWDNTMCALSLEDAAKLFDLDCDFYEDSPVRVVTDEPSRFYTSALVAPGSAAFLSTCGAEPLQRSQAIVNVLKKASEILIRRWDIAAAAVAEGKNKKPVV